MTIQTESYLDSLHHLPAKGQHIIGHQVDDTIVVYQAYNHQIADFAVKHQCLGGNHFSYNRMSWIKPNFLWMMYRCGWAQKENQQRVLSIWLKKIDFERLLSQAVFSSFKETQYANHEEWRKELESKEVRLQWDPDHDPYGNKLTRRAIQLGLKGKTLESFGKENIIRIEDITSFVVEQRQHVEAKNMEKLLVPIERVYQLFDKSIKIKIGLDLKR
jgi:hypothetical protein